jgi:hypothetical protein
MTCSSDSASMKPSAMPIAVKLSIVFSVGYGLSQAKLCALVLTFCYPEFVMGYFDFSPVATFANCVVFFGCYVDFELCSHKFHYVLRLKV